MTNAHFNVKNFFPTQSKIESYAVALLIQLRYFINSSQESFPLLARLKTIRKFVEDQNSTINILLSQKVFKPIRRIKQTLLATKLGGGDA